MIDQKKYIRLLKCIERLTQVFIKKKEYRSRHELRLIVKKYKEQYEKTIIELKKENYCFRNPA